MSDLTSYQTLLDYLQIKIGPPAAKKGIELYFRCPFGEHSRPKLSVVEKKGEGLAWCHACACGGNIFALAEHFSGISRKSNFAALSDHIRETLNLPKTTTPATTKPTSFPPPEPTFLSDKDAECLLSLDTDFYAHETLGISAKTLTRLTERGLIRTLPDGRIVYIYYAWDNLSQQYKITGAKVRNAPRDVYPFPKITNGRLCLSGEMPADLRFLYICGKQFSPWLEHILKPKSHTVIITEGESDACAVLDSLVALNIHTETKKRYSVLALPGTSGMKPYYNHLLKDRAVILVADNDAPGQKAAEKNAQIIASGNPITVRTWSPPPGTKDARAFHSEQENQQNLILSILKHAH